MARFYSSTAQYIANVYDSIRSKNVEFEHLQYAFEDKYCKNICNRLQNLRNFRNENH